MHLGADAAAGGGADAAAQMPVDDEDEDVDGDDGSSGDLATLVLDHSGLKSDCVAELYPHQTAALASRARYCHVGDS